MISNFKNKLKCVKNKTIKNTILSAEMMDQRYSNQIWTFYKNACKKPLSMPGFKVKCHKYVFQLTGDKM